jgi:hypothetical protein
MLDICHHRERQLSIQWDCRNRTMYRSHENRLSRLRQMIYKSNLSPLVQEEGSRMPDYEGLKRKFLDEATGTAGRPRAVGSPLSRGGPPHSGFINPLPEPQPPTPPPPGRALTTSHPVSDTSDAASGLQRAINALRSAVPFVQRLLPLLDGNIIGAVSNVITHAQQRPAAQVDLAPLQESVAELQLQHRELHDQVIEQNTSLKKVEDKLQMVREATDRNTLEQQELMQDLRAVGKKVNMIAFIALGLLAVSILLNVILYLHIQRVLP